MASCKDFKRAPSTGIRVIIVGAGFAGLTAAIESTRKGHSVIVLEKFTQFKVLGDIISLQPNAGRIFARWPGMTEQLYPICHSGKALRFKTYKGEELFTQDLDNEDKFGKKFSGHRGEIHELVWNYAKELGIDIRLGQVISEYFETDSEAGVVSNGVRHVGHVVLAGDGVRSTGRTSVLGFEDKPQKSGYAIYRAWLDSTEIRNNPLTSYMVENGDTFNAWVGPDKHFLATSFKDGKDFSWVCTHKDDTDIKESWQTPGKIEDALKVLQGWDPVVLAIVRATPACVDWKVVYRDPLPTWISPKARIALIGDAAHPFLPTATQGASQAMEDGCTFAICFELAGKQNIPEAVRAYEKMRYDRVRAAQKTGEDTRNNWHRSNHDRLASKPTEMKKLSLHKEAWLLAHDADAHAYKVYPEIIKNSRGETTNDPASVPKDTVADQVPMPMRRRRWGTRIFLELGFIASLRVRGQAWIGRSG